MVTISVRVDADHALKSLAVLRGDAPLAISRAINRTLANVRTVMTRAVATNLKIKQATVRDRIHLREAAPALLTGQINADNRPIPVLLFNARGPEPSRGRGRGVTANTRQRRYPHAFLATMASGHRGVFQRVGKPRLKIRELRDASVAAVFINQHAIGEARAQEQFPKNLAHEVTFLIRKSGLAR
jgi:hypothetical protein